MASEYCSEKLIDAALELFMRQGYEATTIDQIAAAADVPSRAFARHFATKDAAVLSIVDDLLQATAAALGHVEPGASPEHALLIATNDVLAAIIEGRGVITPERMVAMADVVTANRNLQKQASARRKRVLTQALAVRMGVSPENRRVRRAVTMWSAVAAGAYTRRLGMPPGYYPRDDHRLPERITARLSEIFSEVLGEHPGDRSDCQEYDRSQDNAPDIS